MVQLKEVKGRPAFHGIVEIGERRTSFPRKSGNRWERNCFHGKWKEVRGGPAFHGKMEIGEGSTWFPRNFGNRWVEDLLSTEKWKKTRKDLLSTEDWK
jgi:hypothetical protein